MRSIRGSAAAAATTLTVALLISACTTGGGAETESLSTVPTPPTQSSPIDDAAEEVQEDASPAPDTQPTQDLQVEGIFEAALAVVPGVVIGIEDDTHGGTPVWEVLVRSEDGTGTEVKIDQATGKVVAQEPERLSALKATATQVSIEQAIAVALTEVPGTLLEMELDDEKGAVIWEAKVRGEAGVQKVKIDATTAEVLQVKKDH